MVTSKMIINRKGKRDLSNNIKQTKGMQRPKTTMKTVGELWNKKNQNTQVALGYERGDVASNPIVRLTFLLPPDEEKTK